MKPLATPLTPTRNRRLNELLGLVLVAAAGLLLLALVSYHPADRSWNTVGSAGPLTPAHNWAGTAGAHIGDLLLQLLGIAAFSLPLLLGATGIHWMRSRAVGSLRAKAIGLALYILFAPAAFGLLPGHLHWLHAIPVEGVVGRLTVDLLTRYLNLPGAAVVILAGVLVATLLTTAFSFANARTWIAIRFAFLYAWRDRLRNWKQRRARAQADRAANRIAARRKATLAEAETSAPGRQAAEAGLLAWCKRTFSHKPGQTNVAGEDDETLVIPRRASFMGDVPAQTATPAPSPARAPSLWEQMPRAASPQPSPDFEAAVEDQPADVPADVPAPERPRGPLTAAQRSWMEENEARPARVPAAARITPQPPEPPARPRPSAPEHISIGERADADIRPVTVTPKSVSGFRLPPSTLLHRSEENRVIREEELREEAKVLVEKCGEFDVRGAVTQINPGPVVTTFEFRPEAGVKYSRVTGLADDLCLAMAAESILIERMAGKSTVGIQVPNSERETIWLRDVVECESFINTKSKLALAMGKDINGRIVTADLATMPHVLIAGSTGSGKSVAINAMIMSVLFKATPEQVRLILVDPKRVELGMYEGIPHLFTPIITEPKLAANALRNAVREMERRLKLLASKSVRNIDQYNKLFDTPSLFDDDPEAAPLPYIIIIIDELADLMMLDKANVEEAITRLAQMARAVGIHLVLATQRPSVDVITGLIKANVPTRISFRLSTKVDSRTILDSNGAEALLGRGDMLFLPPGTSRLQRVHAPFVTEKEISAVVDFWKSQGAVEYAEGFLESPKDEKGRDLSADGGEGDDNDELFDDAVRLVFEFGKASTSLIQRRLRVGYGRAAHLIDMMERDGLVGPADGSKPREILKSPDWVSEVESSIR